MSSILTRLGDGVLTVTLNRPEKLNAFTGEMLVELRAAPAESDRRVRALLLTGAGRGFCAGQDVRAHHQAAAPPDLGATLENYYNPLVRAMAAMRKPLVCAVNGVAVGAGANLPLPCDIVFAARSATFIQAFARIGLIPDAGGTWLLPRALGLPRALALLAEPLSAETAARRGLIWKVVDDDRLMAEAGAAARQLARGPTFGLGLIEHTMRGAASRGLAEQLDAERDWQRAAGRQRRPRRRRARLPGTTPAAIFGNRIMTSGDLAGEAARGPGAVNQARHPGRGPAPALNRPAPPPPAAAPPGRKAPP